MCMAALTDLCFFELHWPSKMQMVSEKVKRHKSVCFKSLLGIQLDTCKQAKAMNTSDTTFNLGLGRLRQTFLKVKMRSIKQASQSEV